MKAKVVLGAVFAAAMWSGVSLAKTCEINVEGTDQMSFNVKEITIEKDCKDVKLTLKHVGKMPKAAMGHNLVISTTADMAGVVGDAAKAGAAADYLKAGDKRVLAHTKLIGGGEQDSVTFKKSVLKAGGDFMFYCTFPGHAGLMKGKVVVK